VNAAEIMRRLARAAETGDAAAYWSLHTDDFVAHIPGQSRIGGDHRGRRALEALDDLENDLTQGSIEHEVHDTLLSTDHAVLLMRLLASRPGRGTLDARVVYVYHLRDGKLAELWTHPLDQARFDEFWADLSL
jgi:ketosteroid isomerase-like protein